MCKNFLSLEKYLEIGFFTCENSNMSDKASSTNPNLTWELSNGASASIRRGGGSNNYQLCIAYRNSDSSDDVIHPLITSTVDISEVGTAAL